MALLTAGKRNWCLTQKSQSAATTASDEDSSRSTHRRRSARPTRRWIIRSSYGFRCSSKRGRKNNKNVRTWNMTCTCRLNSTKRSKSRHRRRTRNLLRGMIKTSPRLFRSRMCLGPSSLDRNRSGEKNQSSSSTSDPILRKTMSTPIPISRGRPTLHRCRRNSSSTIPTRKRSGQCERPFKKKWMKFIEKYSNLGTCRSISS